MTEAGLAGRIAVNTAVDTENGGELWRLRDGLLAPVEGPVGNAAGLTALHEALSAARVPASGGYSGAARAAQALLENGVDTDQELQKLLLIEQAYAANARVIQTVDALFDTLMRI